MDLVTMIMACSLYRDNSIINAMVKLNSQNNPLQVTTVLKDGSRNAITVANPVAGEAYVNQALARGNDVYIGLLQIPGGWLEKYRDQASVAELFRPCKNMVVATTILNHASEICAKQLIRDPQCDLAIYQTGNNTIPGQEYANKIISYAATHKIPMSPQLENTPPEETPPVAVIPKEVELPEPEFNSMEKVQE